MEVNHGHISASELSPKPVSKSPKKKSKRKVEPISDSKGSKLDTKA
jgi:hypothetical protein